MNQMNRAALAAIGANPAEIVQAACGSGRLPEYNPRGGPGGFVQGGGGGMAQVALKPGAVATMQPQFQLGAPQAAPAAPSPQPAFQPRAPVYHYVPPAPGNYTSNLLSNSQKLWLHRRALWFHELLGGGVPNPSDTDTVATLSAIALVGDDFDPITKGAMPGWDPSQWQAAHSYVHDNLYAWFVDAYPPAGG